MVINRVIDNAAARPRRWRDGRYGARATKCSAPPWPPARPSAAATLGAAYPPEWAAWANGVAVRELDFHDTFLAAEYSHPGDNIPPVLAVAQHAGRSGAELVRGIAVAYEVQVELVKAICLHAHKIDHVAHLGPRPPSGSVRCSSCRRRDVYQADQPGRCTRTTHDPAVAQGRDLQLEGLRAGLRRQDRDRGRRPGDARRGRASPDLRGRGRGDRLAAGRPEAVYTVPLPAPASRSGRSSRPTPRSTPPSTRRRR